MGPTKGQLVRTVYLLATFTCCTSLASRVPLSVLFSQRKSAERTLVNDLLARYEEYGKVARPVEDSDKCLKVSFGLRLLAVELDAKQQVMKTSVWIRMNWIDKILRWNSSEYEGVSSVVLPPDKIWIPDITLVNTATVDSLEQHTGLKVSRSGSVFWAPHRTYTSACLIDVTEYPYDRHTCEMWFQSVSHSGDNVNISAYYKSPLDMDTYLSSYKDAQEWEIVSNETSWHKRPRDAGMILMWSRRAAQRFVLTLQRRPGFQAMLLIVPCTLLSLLFPIIFCLPPERPDRHTMAMSLFASLTILLFMVNEVAPPSASFVPRLALYYCFNLMLLLLATVCSAVVVNINKRGETHERVPLPVQKIFFKCVGKLLCLHKKLDHLREVQNRHFNRTPPSRHDVAPQEPQPISEVPENYPKQHLAVSNGNSPDDKVLKRLSRKIAELEKSLTREPAPEASPCVPLAVRLEWTTLAMICDRMFFVLFLVMVLVSLGVFYPRTA